MKSKLKICIEFWNIDLNLLLLMSLCIEDNCFGGLNICLDKADRRSVHKGWSQVHAVNGSIDCTQSRPHPVRFCWHPLVLFLQILNKKINFWIKFFLEMCVWPLFTCFKVQINGNKIISFFFSSERPTLLFLWCLLRWERWLSGAWFPGSFPVSVAIPPSWRLRPGPRSSTEKDRRFCSAAWFRCT